MIGRRWRGWSAATGCVGAAFALAAGTVAFAPGAGAAPNPAHANPHAYRHGQVPTREAHAAAAASSASDLSYHGGTGGVGVTSGQPRVYVVFWGSQWGTAGVNAAGDTTFGGDTQGMAPYLQAFLKGLGSGNEAWSGVMTQYCDGSGVSTGSYTCPTGASQVGYPTGGALTGVWADTAAAAPTYATAAQLAGEAQNAAAHFGLTATSSRYAQVVVVSPTGTHPDDYNTIFANWCAWHDHTADPSIGLSPAPAFDLAFTNLPYLPDMGASCGANFVNSGGAGALDGVSIVGGHEYAETLTDQLPNSDSAGNITTGGWADSSSSENGDKCAWISSGQGAAVDLSLATGSFAVQSTWANDFNGGAGGCETSHPIVTSATSGSLSFTSAAQSLQAGTWSGPMAVSASSGTPAVSLSSSSAAGVFSLSPGGSSVSSVQPGQSFYYSDTAAGTPTLTAAASGYSSATQTETVAAGPLSVVTVSPASATVGTGGTQTFTASGADAYGNRVAVSAVTWTQSTPNAGTLSSSTGTSTTFTAGSSAGSATLTATSGGISGTASVTVQAKSMTVTVTAGKSTRRSGTYRTPLTATATDASTSAALAGATVNWAVYSGTSCTGTAVATTTGTTNSSGQSSVTFKTRTYGTYCARATVTAAGYPTGSGSSVFTN